MCHVATCELRKARRKARHTTGSRPPWPGVRRAAALVGRRPQAPDLAQIVILVARVAVFTVLSLAASAGRGLSEAATSSLAALWQVQGDKRRAGPGIGRLRVRAAAGGAGMELSLSRKRRVVHIPARPVAVYQIGALRSHPHGRPGRYPLQRSCK